MVSRKALLDPDARKAPDRSTSYQVARRAGVSPSAVSRCFRPGGVIAPETRRRVEAAALELDYQPNAFASGLITRRTNLVAVIISNLTNLYYPEVLAALTSCLDQRGMRVLLFALEDDSDVDAALDQVWRCRVDGAICTARLSAAQVRLFARQNVPLILYNRTGEDAPVTSVRCDSIDGENMLVDRLLAAGHRRFGIISGPDDSFVGRQRVDAAMTRLAASGVTPRLVTGNFDHPSGAVGLRSLLREGERPEVIICANDLMAIGAIDAARHEYNLELPRDLSIVGFDGVGPARWTSYSLTTVSQPVTRMTDAAVTMLMDRIAVPGMLPETRTFSGQLIEGRSAKLGMSR